MADLVDIAGREVGRDVAIAGAGTGRFYFGPFEQGEGVEGLVLALQAGAPVVAAVNFVNVDLAVFTQRPVDTAAAFAANGRVLTRGSPSLPVGVVDGVAPQSLGPAFDLPVGWVANGPERYFGVQLTEAAGGVAISGSLWIRRVR